MRNFSRAWTGRRRPSLWAAVATGALLTAGLPLTDSQPAQAANAACVQGTHYTQTLDGAKVYLTFIAAGTCDWSVPAGVTSLSVTAVGAGGGGGGAFYKDAATQNGGGGGGGGQVTTNPSLSVTSADTFAVTIGAGGDGGTGVSTTWSALVNGSSGGPTSFTAGQKSVQSAAGAGGLGGTANGTPRYGGAGGASGSGLAGGGGGSYTLYGTLAGGGGGGGGDAGPGIGYPDDPNSLGGLPGGPGTSGSGGGGGGGGRGANNDGSGGSASSGGGRGGSVTEQNGYDGADNSGGGGGGGGGYGPSLSPAAGNGGDGGSGRVVVNYDNPVPVLIAETPPTLALKDGIYTYTFAASGDTPITYSVPTGSLPTNMSLDTNTGALTGNPNTVGSFTFQVKATNQYGDDTSPPITVNVVALAPPDPGARALSWGRSNYGQLGNGGTADDSLPVQVLSGANSQGQWKSVSGGYLSSCGIGLDDSAYCWGQNNKGQLGIGNVDGKTSPVLVSDGANTTGTWAFISAGAGESACGTNPVRDAYCWGSNATGQLGMGAGSTANQTLPVQVDNGANTSGKWTSISAGRFSTCGVGLDDSAYCWGESRFGQLGNASISADTWYPVRVDPGANASGKWHSVSAGNESACGIGLDDSITYCWGYDSNQSAAPVAVGAGANTSGKWQSVSTGDGFACGLGLDDSAYCWGSNAYGNLGDGTTQFRSAPVRVAIPNAARVQTILTNGQGSSTCALASGTLYCWGRGNYGQVGNGTNVDVNTRPLPVTVAGLVAGGEPLQVSLGGSHVLAIAKYSDPTVTTVTPPSGPTSGATRITVAGTGFQPGASVNVGGVTCGGVSVESATSLACTTGERAAGSVDVAVTNLNGGDDTGVGLFTYAVPPVISSVSPSYGYTSGGAPLTITGTGFVSGAMVQILDDTGLPVVQGCTDVSVESSTSLTCTTPEYIVSTVDVRVTNPDGQGDTDVEAFAYSRPPAPMVTAVSPSTGPPSGGTRVTVSGVSLTSTGISSVTLGGVACGNLDSLANGSVTCTTGAAPEGVVNVDVTNYYDDTAVGVGLFTYATSSPTPPAPDAPSAPQSVTARAGDRSAVVSWSPPTSSGSFTVSTYKATATPGGATCLTAELSCVVTGLTNGQPYTFTVLALSGSGWGPPSSPSNPVTPGGVTPAPDVEPIPAPLPPGESVLQVNGVVDPNVTVDPKPSDKGLLVTGDGWDMDLDGLGPDGKPLNLGPNGALRLANERDVQTEGSGFLPNSEIDLYVDPPVAASLQSRGTMTEAIYVGTVRTDAKGDFSGTAVLPEEIEAGAHVLQAAGFAPSGKTRALSLGVIVDPWIMLDKGSRASAGRHDRIRATGMSGGIDAGTKLKPLIKYRGQSTFQQGKATIVVKADGTFTWTRLIRADKAITAYVAYQVIESNSVTWGRVR